MKQKHLFFLGVPAVLLVLLTALAGCQAPTLSLPGVDDPDVTAVAVNGGAFLMWDPVVEAKTYEIWRAKEADDDDKGEVKAVRIGSVDQSNSKDENNIGKLYFYDLLRQDNPLEPNRTYVYTVLAVGTQSVSPGKWEDSVEMLETWAAKDTQTKAPEAVSFTLDPDKEEIRVTITKPDFAAASDVPYTGFWVEVFHDNTALPAQNSRGWSSGLWIDAPINSAEDADEEILTGKTVTAVFAWPLSSRQNVDGNGSNLGQIDGAYYAKASAGSADWAGNVPYYKGSDAIVSAKTAYAGLFDDAPTASNWGSKNDTTGALTGYVGRIQVKGKPGVTYKVERAAANADTGVVSGAWADISGSLKSSNSDSAPAAKLTADAVGWVGYYHDRDIPSAGGAYKYRVTGTKDGKSQTKEADVVNFTAQQIARSGQISIMKKAAPAANTDEYTVTPQFTNGSLAAGDKVVLYYARVIGGSAIDGVFSSKIEFSAGEVNTTAVTAKALSIARPTTGSLGTVYVVGYIEFADGTKKNTTVFSNSWYDSASGTTISNAIDYSNSSPSPDGGSTQYYALSATY